MDTINELVSDERTARIILATVSEPGDAMTGRMIRTVGASETVARVVADELPPGPDGDSWQRRLAPRLDPAQVQRVLAETERYEMRVLIPGDAEWPAGIDALGDGAPVALWAKGDTGLLARPVWDRLTVTGARASTGYGEHVTTELVQSAIRTWRDTSSHLRKTDVRMTTPNAATRPFPTTTVTCRNLRPTRRRRAPPAPTSTICHTADETPTPATNAALAQAPSSTAPRPAMIAVKDTNVAGLTIVTARNTANLRRSDPICGLSIVVPFIVRMPIMPRAARISKMTPLAMAGHGARATTTGATTPPDTTAMTA